MLRQSETKQRTVYLAAALLLLLSATFECAAQSSDPGFPAPVFSNDISGRIAPRDLGDPRRTRHFYTFRATEGDVLVTLEGSELVGSLDVFTATTQRPLIKITLLGDATRITKSFYVRKEDTLILRVEARTAGEVEGAYRITFGGSFAPTDLASAPQPSAPTVSSEERRGKNTRRVTSTGARIEEPTPAPTPVEEAKEKEATPAEATNAEKTAARKAPPTPRKGRGARPGSSRARAGTTKSESSGQPIETKADTEKKSDSEVSNATPPAAAPAKKPAPRSKKAKSSNRGARSENAANGETSTSQPAAAAQPAAPSQRLVIVTKDGGTLERDMSTVRRVTVENNQLVVVSKDGKVSRQPMANVLRMSIEP